MRIGKWEKKSRSSYFVKGRKMEGERRKGPRKCGI